MIGTWVSNGSWFAVVTISNCFVDGFRPCIHKRRSAPQETTWEVETNEPAPSASLDPSGDGVELGFERIDAAKGAFDGIFERAWLYDTAVALAFGSGTGKILPEERMIDVACDGSADVP